MLPPPAGKPSGSDRAAKRRGTGAGRERIKEKQSAPCGSLRDDALGRFFVAVAKAAAMRYDRARNNGETGGDTSGADEREQQA